jgi:hypothetical protein
MFPRKLRWLILLVVIPACTTNAASVRGFGQEDRKASDEDWLSDERIEHALKDQASDYAHGRMPYATPKLELSNLQQRADFVFDLLDQRNLAVLRSMHTNRLPLGRIPIAGLPGYFASHDKESNSVGLAVVTVPGMFPAGEPSLRDIMRSIDRTLRNGGASRRVFVSVENTLVYKLDSVDDVPAVVSNTSAMVSLQIKLGFTNGFQITASDSQRVFFPGDAVSKMVYRMRSEAFAKLVTDSSNQNPNRLTPKFRVFALENNESLIFCVGAYYEPQDVVSYDRFKARCRFFVYASLDMHSSNFIYQALVWSKHPEVSAALGLGGARDPIWIPPGWPTQIRDHGFNVVIDGPFAWVYDREGDCWKVDAKQYDPSLHDYFEAARSDAEKELARKGINHTDSAVPLEIEMKRILKRKYGIDWNTRREVDNWGP